LGNHVVTDQTKTISTQPQVVVLFLPNNGYSKVIFVSFNKVGIVSQSQRIKLFTAKSISCWQKYHDKPPSEATQTLPPSSTNMSFILFPARVVVSSLLLKYCLNPPVFLSNLFNPLEVPTQIPFESSIARHVTLLVERLVLSPVLYRNMLKSYPSYLISPFSEANHRNPSLSWIISLMLNEGRDLHLLKYSQSTGFRSQFYSCLNRPVK